jgi:hypothetical protein
MIFAPPKTIVAMPEMIYTNRVKCLSVKHFRHFNIFPYRVLREGPATGNLLPATAIPSGKGSKSSIAETLHGNALFFPP